jgi:hypothetical protein
VGTILLENGRGSLLLEGSGYLELETHLPFEILLEYGNSFLMLNNGAFFELEEGP